MQSTRTEWNSYAKLSKCINTVCANSPRLKSLHFFCCARVKLFVSQRHLLYRSKYGLLLIMHFCFTFDVNKSLSRVEFRSVLSLFSHKAFILQHYRIILHSYSPSLPFPALFFFLPLTRLPVLWLSSGFEADLLVRGERWREKQRWCREKKDKQMAGLIYRGLRTAGTCPSSPHFLSSSAHPRFLSLPRPSPWCGSRNRKLWNTINRERQTEKRAFGERGREGGMVKVDGTI